MSYNAANLDVCKCIGALSHIEAAQKRLKRGKRTPLWLLTHLDEAHRRMESIEYELVKRRDAIPTVDEAVNSR